MMFFWCKECEVDMELPKSERYDRDKKSFLTLSKLRIKVGNFKEIPRNSTLKKIYKKVFLYLK